MKIERIEDSVSDWIDLYVDGSYAFYAYAPSEDFAGKYLVYGSDDDPEYVDTPEEAKAYLLALYSLRN